MKKRAIILAGGKGSRLRPYTLVMPKPLMPIGEYPILEVVIRQLVQHGFEHITMAVNHQAEIIKAFFGDGSKWNIEIDYSLESQPLGTMGPLASITDLPDHFLVMNGDVLTDLNYRKFYEDHVQENRLFTISSYTRKQLIDYGVLETKDTYLSGFIEKPTKDYNVSMGIYMVSKKISESIPKNTFYGFDKLMLETLSKGGKVKVENFNGYWLDIGRPDDYMQAIDEFEKLRNKFLNE